MRDARWSFCRGCVKRAIWSRSSIAATLSGGAARLDTDRSGLQDPPMLDIRYVRENAEKVRKDLVEKLFFDPAPLDEILKLDAERRRLQVERDNLNARRNAISKEMSDPQKRDALRAEANSIKEQIPALEQKVTEIEQKQEEIALLLPNLPHPSVPIGKDDSENVVVREEGKKRELGFAAKPHWDLETSL